MHQFPPSVVMPHLGHLPTRYARYTFAETESSVNSWISISATKCH
jgi:hypothetical protein